MVCEGRPPIGRSQRTIDNDLEGDPLRRRRATRSGFCFRPDEIRRDRFSKRQVSRTILNVEQVNSRIVIPTPPVAASMNNSVCVEQTLKARDSKKMEFINRETTQCHMKTEERKNRQRTNFEELVFAAAIGPTERGSTYQH
jgi:hypothetical protein